MSDATTRRTELHKFYNNNTGVADSAWEKVLLDNARRVSTPLATRVLSQMGLGKETTEPFKVLENACGVGVVAPILQQSINRDILQQSSIVCGDFSEKAVEVAKKRIEREGWVNTTATKVDAQKIEYADAAFTHVATNIGFHVVPDSEAALNEAIRVLQPGGILGLTTWHKEPGWLNNVKEAFESFPFKAPCEMGLQTTEWGVWSDVNWVSKTLAEKGLQDVKVEVFAYLTHVEGAHHFIEACGLMFDWIMASGWSEELRENHPKEEVHKLVKEFLEQKHGGNGWEVSWVAIIASGLKPLEN